MRSGTTWPRDHERAQRSPRLNKVPAYCGKTVTAVSTFTIYHQIQYNLKTDQFDFDVSVTVHHIYN